LNTLLLLAVDLAVVYMAEAAVPVVIAQPRVLVLPKEPPTPLPLVAVALQLQAAVLLKVTTDLTLCLEVLPPQVAVVAIAETALLVVIPVVAAVVAERILLAQVGFLLLAALALRAKEIMAATVPAAVAIGVPQVAVAAAALVVAVDRVLRTVVPQVAQVLPLQLAVRL